jgi:hypothetical protein
VTTLWSNPSLPFLSARYREEEVILVSLLCLILSVCAGNLFVATDRVVRHRSIDGRLLFLFGIVEMR